VTDKTSILKNIIAGLQLTTHNKHRVFPGVKLPGHGVEHPPPYNPEVTENVVTSLLTLYAFMPCYRVIVLTTYIYIACNTV
jgi:hypothetical protein